MELRLPLMYLFAMPRWAPLHRAISVVLLACPGVLLLAGGAVMFGSTVSRSASSRWRLG